MKVIHSEDVTLEFLTSDMTSIIEVPYFDGGVAAGFPSPASDFESLTISFDKEVFGSSPSTIFCARVSGHSMEGVGIFDGSVIAVDRLLEPSDNKIAVCVINGEFTLKRLKVEKDCIWLMPENESFQPLKITDSDEFEIWGIVTHCLNKF
ncbi:MAG: translesion error-prone DNA polymerase V autoproteolytic subunit [Flavobacterium sp.]|nr:translesion error-prone DNA polymerase V autoproteolytic subunit [Flavobacterium sp.]